MAQQYSEASSCNGFINARKEIINRVHKLVDNGLLNVWDESLLEQVTGVLERKICEREGLRAGVPERGYLQ